MKPAPGFVLGFHGCDQFEVAEPILEGAKFLESSRNRFDWLGEGAYFWEGDYERALKWAHDRANEKAFGSRPVQRPYVIGAVIDLGNCLDLVRLTAQELLSESYEMMKGACDLTGTTLPTNKGGKGSPARELDCAVIQFLHAYRKILNDEPFDTVRGMFQEGEPAYPGAEFRLGNHVQIAVRNPAKIIGFFRPRELCGSNRPA